jgi:hypothetical protein
MNKKCRSTPIKGDDEMGYINISLSPAMKRFLEGVSENYGKNANNQASIAHGAQVVILQEMNKIGINTKKRYANINH